MEYNHLKIELKWQKYWQKNKTFKTEKDYLKKKCYVLDMFPYPSGAGLHVGHPLGYTATDIYSRFKRLQGFNVLHPMGWDAFGLPAEQYAIKTGTHPKITTEDNIKNFKRQIQMLGSAMIGIERSIPLMKNIINGLNGYFYNFIKKDSHMKQRYRLIGVLS